MSFGGKKGPTNVKISIGKTMVELGTLSQLREPRRHGIFRDILSLSIYLLWDGIVSTISIHLVLLVISFQGNEPEWFLAFSLVFNFSGTEETISKNLRCSMHFSGCILISYTHFWHFACWCYRLLCYFFLRISSVQAINVDSGEVELWPLVVFVTSII